MKKLCTLSLTVTKLAALALVLTTLVLVPASSQAATVNFQGNTATGIEDVICSDVLYDVEFVYDTGVNVYGEDPEFPFRGASGGTEASVEEQTYDCSRAIQEALNAAPQAITRVGPQSSSFFYIALNDQIVGDTDVLRYWVFESRYYDEITVQQRPEDTWVPADNWVFEVEPGGPIDPDIQPFALGSALVDPNVPWSYAKLTFAEGSPPAADASVGGKASASGGVTGLTGTGLVLQNNEVDDLAINSDGDFVFTTLLAPGTAYSVTVKTQPSDQFCRVANGWGTVPAAGVENVLVTCGDPTLPLDDIIATWSSGIWYWEIDTRTWTQLSTDTTNEDIAAADFTADGIADVAAIFQDGPASDPHGPGIYYLDGVSKAWTLIPGSAPAPFSVTAGDLNGDGRPEVIASWNFFGIWYWDFAAATPAWIQLSTDFTKGDIAAGDFTGDGTADVAAVFDHGPVSKPQGAGLYYLDGDSQTWTLVPDGTPAPFSVTAGDLNGDGRPEVIGTWSVGMWYYDFVAADWNQLGTDTTNSAIAAGNFVSNGIADVAAIFEISPVSTSEGPGLYFQNGVGGPLVMIPDSDPTPFNVTAGDVTGTGEEPEGGVVTVFVTSNQFYGDLGFQEGDTVCQSAAEAAGLTGTDWTAWLSTRDESAKDRIPDAQYIDLNGIQIANGKAELLDGVDNDAPININEHGDVVDAERTVWTGTNSLGIADLNNQCNDWKVGENGDPAHLGQYGRAHAVNSEWTQSYGGARTCYDNQGSLYCFGHLN